MISNIDIILKFLLSLEHQNGGLSYHELFEKITPLIAWQGKESIQKYLEIIDLLDNFSYRRTAVHQIQLKNSKMHDILLFL
jgi:hypothetical protein